MSPHETPELREIAERLLNSLAPPLDKYNMQTWRDAWRPRVVEYLTEAVQGYVRERELIEREADRAGLSVADGPLHERVNKIRLAYESNRECAQRAEAALEKARAEIARRSDMLRETCEDYQRDLMALAERERQIQALKAQAAQDREYEAKAFDTLRQQFQALRDGLRESLTAAYTRGWEVRNQGGTAIDDERRYYEVDRIRDALLTAPAAPRGPVKTRCPYDQAQCEWSRCLDKDPHCRELNPQPSAPAATPERKPFQMNVSREWIERMAKLEEECGDVTVGGGDIDIRLPAAPAGPQEPYASIAALEAGWDGHGSAAIDRRAIDAARDFEARVSRVPIPDGGVQLEWHCHGVSMELEFEADGTLRSVFALDETRGNRPSVELLIGSALIDVEVATPRAGAEGMSASVLCRMCDGTGDVGNVLLRIRCVHCDGTGCQPPTCAPYWEDERPATPAAEPAQEKEE